MSKYRSTIFIIIPLLLNGCGNGDNDLLGGDSNSAPEFKTVTINGGVSDDSVRLFAIADYWDKDGDLEGKSIYSWSLNGKELPNENTSILNLAISPELIGKRIQVTATPIAQTGVIQGESKVASFDISKPTFPDGITPPSATISISGQPAYNSSISATYLYQEGSGSNELGGPEEGNSQFAWYAKEYYSGNIFFQKCNSGQQTNCDLKITENLLNSSIYACVIPVAKNTSYGYMACDQITSEDKKQPITAVFSTTTAYAALRQDGSVITWGGPDRGGDSSLVKEKIDGTIPVVNIVSTSFEFSALRKDGSVVTWGKLGAFQPALTKKAIRVYSIAISNFAAILEDGTVATWGTDNSDISELKDVVSITGTGTAFSAITRNGSVKSWGPAVNGGDISAVASQLDGTIPVVRISSNGYAFAALRKDGSVITWGRNTAGGVSSNVSNAISSGVVALWGTGHSNGQGSFAALRQDGSVITWGNAGKGGDSSAVSAQLNGSNPVVRIFNTSGAYAALRLDGSVVTWGDPKFGGDSSAVSTQLNGIKKVKSIYTNFGAMAAILEDGSVVTWGNAEHGGDSSLVSHMLDGSNPVRLIKGTSKTIDVTTGMFNAIRQDGSVVHWGGALAENYPENDLNGKNPVVGITTNTLTSAALRKDGSVITWGAKSDGGDSSTVADYIKDAIFIPFSDEYDTDGDGIPNLAEISTCVTPYLVSGLDALCTLPGLSDSTSDGLVTTDGMFDGLKVELGYNPLQVITGEGNGLTTGIDGDQDKNGDTYPDYFVIPESGFNIHK